VFSLWRPLEDWTCAFCFVRADTDVGFTGRDTAAYERVGGGQEKVGRNEEGIVLGVNYTLKAVGSSGPWAGSTVSTWQVEGFLLLRIARGPQPSNDTADDGINSGVCKALGYERMTEQACVRCVTRVATEAVPLMPDNRSSSAAGCNADQPKRNFQV
jgi:hypothetical protein